LTFLADSATLAAWVGAIGQTLTANLAAYIAFLTHRHARRSAQATSLKMAYEMVNEFNKIVLYNPQHSTFPQRRARRVNHAESGSATDFFNSMLGRTLYFISEFQNTWGAEGVGQYNH
jgi:hypothetical protein